MVLSLYLQKLGYIHGALIHSVIGGILFIGSKAGNKSCSPASLAHSDEAGSSAIAPPKREFVIRFL